MAGTPIHFPVKEIDLQNSFVLLGMNIPEEELNTDEVSSNLNSKLNCFCIVFRALVPTPERSYDYIKHL